MVNKNPVKYTGEVLDNRNDLTGPDDEGKRNYPNPPKHVPIQQPDRKNT